MANQPLPFSTLSGFWLRHRHLHRNGWTSPHHGFWSDAPRGPEPLQRILDASAVLPDGGAVGGWAAAWLHGARTLDGLDWDGTPLDVTVCVPRRQQVRRLGIDDFRSLLLPGDVTTVDGVPVTSLLRTAFDVARRAGDLIEAVSALDAIAHATDLPLGDLEQYAAERPRWMGVRRVAAAVDLTDRGAVNPYESRMRMLWQLDAGLPPLECNNPLFGSDGRLLGYPDLFHRGSGVALEYDGAHHREPGQHSADNAREEGLERHGVIVVRAGIRDLFPNRTQTVDRMLAAYRDGMMRDRSRDRWETTPPSWWSPPDWFRASA